MVETINKVVRARRTLTQELGREPSNKEIAEMLGEDEDRVTEIMSFSQDPVSMEAPVGDEDDSHLGDLCRIPMRYPRRRMRLRRCVISRFHLP